MIELSYVEEAVGMKLMNALTDAARELLPKPRIAVTWERDEDEPKDEYRFKVVYHD